MRVQRITLTGFWLMPYLRDTARADVVALLPSSPAASPTAHWRPVQATFPIEEIKPALALANAYHRTGKVLVTPNGKVG